MARCSIRRALALSLALLVGACGDAPAKPNILVILADDLAPQAVGAEGNEVVRTPNIDSLADEGAAFARAYVPLPQCGPSRAALLLGRYPHEVGVLSNGVAWSGNETTLANVLGARGYRCGLVGKWHLGNDDRPQAGFEDFWRPIDRDYRGYVDPMLWVDGERHQVKGYLPDLLAERAIEFIDHEDERPFFLWLAYKSPHEPIILPPDEELWYHPDEVPLPGSIGDDLSAKPREQREGVLHQGFQGFTDEDVKRVVSRYYAMITGLDRSVGTVLRHLEERGLAEDTVVVFLSDNGYLAGEHQMVTKGPAFYEELVRTPLYIRWPSRIPSGERHDALASTLDLFPTLAAIAGAETPPGLRGHDLLPIVEGKVEAVREELFLEYCRRQKNEPVPVLGVVTDRYKYARYLGSNEEELYDLVADPLELDNLAASTEHAAVLERLRARVVEFRRTIADPCW